MKSARTPSEEALASTLGSAQSVWNRMLENLESQYGAIKSEWKPSKQAFGSMCLLKQKERTLLYLTPQSESILVAIVLGERAVALALDSDIPDGIKALIRDAKPYAEGRGIRFSVATEADVPMVMALVSCKMRR